MLTHLYIKNFTIIEKLELDISAHFTVVTGETGAGKSIVIDAIELVLGGRAESNSVRHGQEKAEITASFDIDQIPSAQQWLQQQELDNDYDCIIRRIIQANGRSKMTINGTPVTTTQVKALAEILINIHGQHQHQALLKRDYQLQLLDDFANHEALTQQIKTLYTHWQQTQQQLKTLQQQTGNEGARIELLQYQLQELEELNLQPNETDTLHQEYKQLANAETFIQNCQSALDCLTESDHAAATQLNQACHSLATDEHTNTICELLNNSLIQIEEAANELRHYLDKLEINPERFAQVDKRLNNIYDLARKHHVEPEQLIELQASIAEELNQLKNADEHIVKLKQDLINLEKRYLTAAEQLTKSRQQAAKKLSQQIEETIHRLGMPGGKLDISLQPNKDNSFAGYGLERAEFLVSANPGQPLQPLTKVASGGELSRISLAIQVITAQTTTTPTLIFDEVDVGIGGSIAEIVGQLLRKLGENTQIICITHLPQVAAKGHQHLQVQKHTAGNTTTTTLQQLDKAQRYQEIARMLGGIKITKNTLANAKELVDST